MFDAMNTKCDHVIRKCRSIVIDERTQGKNPHLTNGIAQGELAYFRMQVLSSQGPR